MGSSLADEVRASDAEARFIKEVAARGHQGELLYTGGRRGAVFTVVLPPFAS